MANKDNSVEPLGTTEFKRLSSSTMDARSSGRTGVAHAVVPAEFAENARGSTLRIEMPVRTADENGSPAIAIAYSTASAGNSQWQEFEIDGEYQTVSFDYAISPNARAGDHYIGVWADPEGQVRAANVGNIAVSILPAQ